MRLTHFYHSPQVSGMAAAGGLSIFLPIVGMFVAQLTDTGGPAGVSCTDTRIPDARFHPRRRYDVTRRVMIADGNVDAAESLAVFLRLYGHEVATAHTGPAALAAAADFGPETVFLALTLPTVDGYEVCRRLCSDGNRPRVIVALTGHGQEHDKRAVRTAGFDHHLLKPADPNAVLALLQ